MFKSPGSVAFSIFNTDIHWYGILMSVAILAGLFVIFKVRDKYFKEISTDTICDIAFILIVSGIVFARIYYVILEHNYYMMYPAEVIAVWNGGISIQGAITGGILCGYLYIKRHKLNFYRYADLFVFGLVTGQVIGRWGNFFNSEAFGLPSNLPLKLYIPFDYRPLAYRSFEYFHPAFLYESILNLIILITLLIILKRKSDKRQDGMIFLTYIILYSAIRIITEAIRIDSVFDIFGIHIAQVVSVIFIAAAVICMKRISNENRISGG